MIRVSIDLHSAITGQTRSLGTAEICNVGGTSTVGKYRVELFQWGESRRVWKKGWIEGFPRKRLGGWDLLYRCLKEAVGDRNEERDVPEQGAAYWKARALEAENKLETSQRALAGCRSAMATNHSEVAWWRETFLARLVHDSIVPVPGSAMTGRSLKIVEVEHFEVPE